MPMPPNGSRLYAANVSRGPCEAIRVRLPTAWAESTRVEWEDGAHFQRLERRDGDYTVWTIRPDRPIWGARTLILRAIRPLPRVVPLDAPRLEPLGWGSVETYLILTDASERELVLRDVFGLQSIPLSRLPAADRPLEVAGEPPSSAWLVKQDRWTLRIPKPLGTVVDQGTDADETLVEFADIHAAVGEDGSLLGRARFELASKTGAALTVVLPRGGQVLAATVERRARSTAPRRRGSLDHPLGSRAHHARGRLALACPGRSGPLRGISKFPDCSPRKSRPC